MNIKLINIRREIIILSVIFLLSTAALYLFQDIARIYNILDEQAERLLTWVNFRFRDELQYRGNRRDNSNNIYNVDETLNFNYDGGMVIYDYALETGRDYFDRFASLDGVVDYSLTYVEYIYRNALNSMDYEIDFYKFGLAGGDPENYCRFVYEFDGAGYRSINIISGRMYATGECIINEYYAERDGISVGDELDFYSEDASPVITLTVSGIYSVYDDVKEKKHSMEHGPLYCGTMPYGRSDVYTQHAIFCTFDDAYTAYGDEGSEGFSERHIFNKYIAFYRMKDGYSLEKLRESSKVFDYDENFGFYRADRGYEAYYDKYAYGIRVITTLIAFYMPLIAIIIICTRLFEVRRKRRELLILWRLGVKTKRLMAGEALAAALLVLIGCIPAILLVWPIRVLINPTKFPVVIFTPEEVFRSSFMIYYAAYMAGAAL